MGLFTWNTDDPLHSYTEIDIEFARWGDAAQYTNSQYVIQPCSSCPGCDDRCERFRVDLTDQNSVLTHYLIWEEGSVEFRTYYGQHLSSVPPVEDLAHQWIYAGSDVPEPSGEDVNITKRIMHAAKLMDIIVHDHIIIGHNTYRSLRDLGYLNEKQ